MDDYAKNIAINLDWGEITPDSSNLEEKEVFYLCNFSMIDENRRDIVSVFVANKILWYEKHLPEGYKHHIRMDVSEQEEIEFQITMMREWKKITLEKIDNQTQNIDKYLDIIM